jgi:hypothetical protein
MKRLAEAFIAATGLLALCVDPTLAQARVEPEPKVPRMLERPDVTKFDEPSVEPGREIVALEFARQKRDPQDAARRLAAAIQAILGKDAARKLSKETSDEAFRSAVAGEEAGHWVRLADTPILMRYDARYDEIRVIDEERDQLERPARDVGIEGARDAAERFLKELAGAGVIDSRLYRQAAMQIGYKSVGEGPVDKPVQPGRVVGYRVTYRPRLHGFQLANAGLRLGIAASGEVASLRVGGVTPVGAWREGAAEPTGAGPARKVRVSTKELTQRLYRQTPKGAEPRIAWSRIMYVMPEGASRAVLEPMLLISYTQVRQTDEGPVASRRKTLAYSLTDPRALPIDFDAPPTKHEEIGVTRKN